MKTFLVRYNDWKDRPSKLWVEIQARDLQEATDIARCRAWKRIAVTVDRIIELEAV